jgi:hypothetical protein
MKLLILEFNAENVNFPVTMILFVLCTLNLLPEEQLALINFIVN